MSLSFIKRLSFKILRTVSPICSDEIYLRVLYYIMMDRCLHLKKPKLFSEKIQWLKLYNRCPEYITMVDKYAVKEYVAKAIGEEYVIPTLAVYENFDDIDFEQLPNKFVLKTTHGGGGGGVAICKDKKTFEITYAKERIFSSMRLDIYEVFKEWPYKDVPKRIIAEALLEDQSGSDLKDYKLFCFNGKVKFLKVDSDRFTSHRANYYNLDFSLLHLGEKDFLYNEAKKDEKPENFEEMIRLAEILSKDIPFVRIDFYNINGRIYFGEITFFPASGLGKWEPASADEDIGKLLNLQIQE